MDPATPFAGVSVERRKCTIIAISISIIIALVTTVVIVNTTTMFNTIISITHFKVTNSISIRISIVIITTMISSIARI